MVVWKWEWEDDYVDHVSETSSEGFSANNPDLESCSDENEGIADKDKSEEEHNSDALRCKLIHTVTFKCIGVTHIKDAQKNLDRACTLLNEDKQHVPVPEPDNPKDNKAIAFKCFFDGSWHIIGYIVKEALESVHFARDQGRITSVEFS